MAVRRERLVEVAEKVLRDSGIKDGQTALDFGCGHGNYAIPLALLVGPSGKVYALDKDTSELDRLMERARKAGLTNIVRVDSPGGERIGLEDDSVDVVLLYDVIHSHYFSPRERRAHFREVDRVTRSPALLSVFPHHMDGDEIAEVVRLAEEMGFRMVLDYRGPVIHDDDIAEGYVVTFRRLWQTCDPP